MLLYIGLVGGNFVYEGRVEVFLNSTWTTVCDDGWDTTDADVFCRQIGFPGAEYSYGLAAFGQGSGKMQIRNVACTGTETDIRDCPFNTDANTACSNSEDVGVRCLRNISKAGCCIVCGNIIFICMLMIGLINGTQGESSEGRIEVYRNNMWGTVCDDAFDRPDANTACRQWGANTPAISYAGNAAYGQGSGPIQLDNFLCQFTQDSLFYCGVLTFHDCSHAEDAGVSCPTVRKFQYTLCGYHVGIT